MENRTLRFMLAAESILLLPLVGMLVTDDVDWGLLDFVIVSILLAGLGFAFSLIMGKSADKKRIAIGLVLAAIIFLVYAELAVGVFGTPLAGS